MKDGLSQNIVNVEAQKDEPSAYKIVNRAIFYVSRLISSQKERDFANMDLLNIVLIGVTNELPAHNEKYELHRLLCIYKVCMNMIKSISLKILKKCYLQNI